MVPAQGIEPCVYGGISSAPKQPVGYYGHMVAPVRIELTETELSALRLQPVGQRAMVAAIRTPVYEAAATSPIGTAEKGTPSLAAYLVSSQRVELCSLGSQPSGSPTSLTTDMVPRAGFEPTSDRFKVCRPTVRREGYRFGK